MERKAEGRIWSFPVLHLLVLYSSSFSHMPCKGYKLLPRGSVVVPFEVVRVPIFTDGSVNIDYRVKEWKTPEICLERKYPIILSANVGQDARSRICGSETMKGAEETCGGHCCELLRPLHDYDLVIVETEASNEDIETIRDEGGSKASEFRHRHEAL